MAFYDARVSGGDVPATAYLLTARQFSDVVDQEMWRPPGSDLDFSHAISTGRATLGPGRYETVHCVGALDGHPVLTFTADVLPPLNAPSAAYLRTMARGLRGVHGMSEEAVADYVAGRPGADP